ncbi:2Fe-2S iron-sulfur cluster binding domain-containing protein [Chitinophaga sp. SYP-B3965]|uniref:ferredoxin--NADP reductase n=1 Tax=Chitinophaga sp. SYP-B3965 TaxID=2663120 RepID=UPI00129989F7|nr:ferredoxin--NADP reductase [Chitinophaga sp. SYP-B3965]MRG49106.1 2Fe-2S iron-sulfur cluster binding domain-containing protein [Chitinophaga sp. SYP-B3965]
MNDLYIQLRITAIIPETPDTFTYQFEEVNGKPVPYQAGQFLTFLITLHGKEIRRSYSLSSTPGIDPHLSVTVKRITNGEISRHIIRYWKVGDTVTSLLPSGRFTLESQPDTQRDLFLIAAGSGITPLFSILKHALKTETAAHITLLYSTRNKENTIFYQQILALQQQYPERLTILWLFSDPEESAFRRMSNGLLEMLAPQHLKYDRELAQFFICGPSEYMRMVQFTLVFLGFNPAHIHKENFVINTEAKIARIQIPQDTSIKQVLLQVKGKEQVLEVPGNESILHAALRQDVHLPYSCKGGVCGSCIAKCTGGKVWMSVNEVLTDKELAQGLILTCTGYAQSDKVILEW